MSSSDFNLDTSVLVRLLTGLPEKQFSVALEFLREQRHQGREIHITAMVIAEAYFALQTHYGYSKADAIKTITLFVKHSGVDLEESLQKVLQTPGLASSNPGFVDRLIHAECMDAGHSLVSFEKAAKKLESTVVLKG